ncbi:MAG: metal-sensing transcriptional repressor [Patescibacteria group bacterium]|nr:metal-sensing transcriptional repressor [Patescibacteria group bacterium]
MIQPIKKRASHRAKIIDGQFKGLIKRIDNEEYCIDILTQSLAIQKSISSLNKLILENHLRTCAQEKLISPDETVKEAALQELLHLYELGKVRSK